MGSGEGDALRLEIDHSGMGAAYLRSHPQVPIAHKDSEPCARCEKEDDPSEPHESPTL